MSELLKTRAVTLRIHPYSRTSHIVNWLTPERGSLATLNKGACRPRSGLLGQYDLFYVCELVVYVRPHGGLMITRECTPLNAHSGLRGNWRATACASYAAHLVERFALPGSDTRDLFGLLAQTLAALETTNAFIPLLVWFELRFLQVAGAAPAWSICGRCRRPLLPADHVLFAPASGFVICPACEMAAVSTAPMRPSRTGSLTPDLRALLVRWQQLADPRLVARYPITTQQAAVLQTLTGELLDFHIDIGSARESRQLAYRCAGDEDTASLLGMPPIALAPGQATSA